MNNETVKTTSKLTTEIKQVEALLDPIKDEEERMKIILSQQKVDKALDTNRGKDEQIKLSAEAE